MTQENWWQSQTFRAFVLYLVTMIANAVARKWGYSLNAEEIAGLTVALVGFIAGRQYKQAKLLDNDAHPVQRQAAPVVTALSQSPVETPEQKALSDSIAAAPAGYKIVVPVLLLALLSSSGCAWWQKQTDLKADLSACASTAVVGEVEALMGEAAQAIQQSPVDWDRHLDQLVARGGQAALCAILALADALSSGTGGSQTDPLGDYDRATRAAYLRAYARGVAGR